MQGTQVRSLVRELRSHMLRGAAKKENNKKGRAPAACLCNVLLFGDMNEGHPGHIYITGLSHADAKKAIS